MGFFDLNEVELLDVPWEKDLQPGPVGEYLEVVDVDPPERLRLRAGRSQSSRPAGAERLQADAGQSAVPSADGLCRGHEDHRPFREGAGPRRTVGAAYRHDRRPADIALRPPSAHLSARAARGQCLLQPGKMRVAVRLLPRRRRTATTICRAAWCSTACRTTSWRTRPPMRCSTGCIPATRSRPASTCWPFTRPSPTSWRCSSISPFRRCFARRSAKPRGHAGLSEKLADLAVQFGDAIGSARRALRSAIGSKPKADDYQTRRSLTTRGALLVAAVFCGLHSRLRPQDAGSLPAGHRRNGRVAARRYPA